MHVMRIFARFCRNSESPLAFYRLKDKADRSAGVGPNEGSADLSCLVGAIYMRLKFSQMILTAGMAGLLGVSGCVVKEYSEPPPPPPPPVVYAPPPPPPPVQPAYGDQVVVNDPPPPVVQEEVIGVAPGPDYIWVSGYYVWHHENYHWVHGHWGRRPWNSAVWVGGEWRSGPHGYVFVRGYWR
jgi:hypothetical protein